MPNCIIIYPKKTTTIIQNDFFLIHTYTTICTTFLWVFRHCFFLFLFRTLFYFFFNNFIFFVSLVLLYVFVDWLKSGWLLDGYGNMKNVGRIDAVLYTQSQYKINSFFLFLSFSLLLMLRTKLNDKILGAHWIAMIYLKLFSVVCVNIHFRRITWFDNSSYEFSFLFFSFSFSYFNMNFASILFGLLSVYMAFACYYRPCNCQFFVNVLAITYRQTLTNKKKIG